MGRPMATRSSPGATAWVVDQTVVSVGPYRFTRPPGTTPVIRAASAAGSGSPPSSTRCSPASAPGPDPATRTEASDGVHCRWVTAWRRISRASAPSPPACATSGCTTTRKPRTRVHSSSSTWMSKPMRVTASQVPGIVPPTRASIPAKKLVTLACVTCTPLGRPVEPEV
jgi:hypothetical protein